MQELNKLDFEMSHALEVGYSEELDKTYMVLTWLEGERMSQCISNYYADEQFHLGMEAGRILKKIHQLPVVFCKPFLHKVAKTFCRSLQLHFVGRCNTLCQT